MNAALEKEAKRGEARLINVLQKYAPLAIAVSGGVDSLTLACVAKRALKEPPLMVHAISASVPVEATLRVRAQAAKEGWHYLEIHAGEYDNPNYRANPLNRCYYCKSSLYQSIASVTKNRIASGANLDDLSDYRPGLEAAAEHQVVHPFIEAKIDKASLRGIARLHGLHHFSELPAAPCLSSRIETGIAIDKHDLQFIGDLERDLRAHLGDKATIRVRLRAKGVSVELGEMPQETLLSQIEMLAKNASAKLSHPFIGILPYQQGSAFIQMKVFS